MVKIAISNIIKKYEKSDIKIHCAPMWEQFQTPEIRVAKSRDFGRGGRSDSII